VRIRLVKWLPTVLMMLIIFLVSARSSSELPDFGWADALIKKSGHMVGYALLALFSWRAQDLKKEKCWVAWLIAIVYAVTDEFHQSFVPGRHPSIWDVLIFDNMGALVSLGLATRYGKQKQSRQSSSIVTKIRS
jgi:VanZ family protein